MQLFYESEILSKLHLDEGESKHCVKVLRKSKGDVLHIVDGKGNLIEAIISDPNHKKVVVEITEYTRKINEFSQYQRLLKPSTPKN